MKSIIKKHGRWPDGICWDKGGMGMTKTRLEAMVSLMKGLLSAIALTLVGMTAIAALAVYAQATDGTIRVMNQGLKCLAILLGVRVAVGRGGRRGFFTGMTLAMIYMALGYAMAVGMGGSAFAVPGMLGEILIGAALGAVAGAVLSNMPARRLKVS